MRPGLLGEGLVSNQKSPCAENEHSYVFLRQEKTNVGFERNPHWRYEDVFFCERCLHYERVFVKETEPDRL